VGGLHKFKAGKLTTFTARNGLSDNRIKCILIDKKGNTWIGTENGLNRYDPAAGKFELFNFGLGLSGNSIEFIYEDSRGDLWIGASVGLNRLSGGKISPFKLPVGKEAYFPKCAYQDNEGTLWIGTDRGLIRVLGKEDELTGAPLKNTRFRLTETEVNTILEDDRGNIWLAGGKGISRVAKNELTDFAFGKIQQVNMETYNEKDGMKSRWVIGLGCKSRDGKLWFPTSMGVAVIDPAYIEKDALPLSPIIEKFLVDGEIIRTNAFQGLRSGGDGLSKKPPRPKAAAHLELAPGKKRLEFYYTAVSFINSQKIKFKIKLEGYDSDWEDVGVRRNSSYNGLAPGHYTFKVTACNRYGIWSAEPATFSFYLRPYFYQTTWFYVSVVFIAILAFFTFHGVRFRRLRARARELEMMVAERTEQLAAANKELSRLANLDPLTGIANRRRFMEYLTVEWQREIRSSGTIAIVMIDVDFFKKYNDSYGHQAGDECLRKVAGVIASAARRPGDMAARYGGEEFVVVLPGASREGACKAAENIKDGVEALEIPHTVSVTGFVTISLGVSLASPRQGEQIENLISLADRALYLAKEQGRNRVFFVPPGI
jgi:diguanylate cyclase (GGDEF)-like protein